MVQHRRHDVGVVDLLAAHGNGGKQLEQVGGDAGAFFQDRELPLKPANFGGQHGRCLRNDESLWPGERGQEFPQNLTAQRQFGAGGPQIVQRPHSSRV